MRLFTFLTAAAVTILLAQEEAGVSFDLRACGFELTLETGLAILANSYVAGVPWGLVRAWFTAQRNWSGLNADSPFPRLP